MKTINISKSYILYEFVAPEPIRALLDKNNCPPFEFASQNYIPFEIGEKVGFNIGAEIFKAEIITIDKTLLTVDEGKNGKNQRLVFLMNIDFVDEEAVIKYLQSSFVHQA